MIPMADKVAHVRAARDSGKTHGHHCHWPGCDKLVAPAMWGCAMHWRKLPIALRNRIWRCYRPGQEVAKNPSAEYVEAARAVQDWILANHPPEPKQERFL